ncbi:NAD(P)-dependent alcohol dehydrogenase [uncultured Victivallis sp.]|uniref:NAD(P)-dependent alcohol dehydrogenase n=1 Tax=uncultured Victivallis sp. TaxID=354118 RepID=UPI0025F621A0|nr:NAD(P)-dependent alcohol dehydrogenase [uncultured Victivallis sp.]
MKKMMMTLMSAASLVSSGFAAETESRIPARGLALDKPGSDFRIVDFTRDALGPKDILIEIDYSGICHSDIHSALNEHAAPGSKPLFPIIPGHEMAGHVVRVGSEVKKFAVGDLAGVGCFVDSCGECRECKRGLEQFCLVRDPVPNLLKDGRNFRGGYSNRIVVPERNAIKIPAGAELSRVAPLLCAGITVWSPIHFSKVKKGDTVGVAGFGGLGHMAVKYLADLGAKVTVFDITEEKRDDALRMGAERYVNMKQPEAAGGLADSFDFIISTIPSDYRLTDYAKLLKYGTGELAVVGLPPTASVKILELLAVPHRKIYTSVVGGIGEHQECMDYSVAHGIYPEVKIIPATPEALKEAYQNVIDGKVKFRYVIDMKTLK